MKKIELFYTKSSFEEFANRKDIKILQIEIKAVDISINFQEGFFGIIFYEEN